MSITYDTEKATGPTADIIDKLANTSLSIAIPRPAISIVTPWRNHPELLPTYTASVQGAQVIIVNNASDFETSGQLLKLTNDLGGKYIANTRNESFAHANNQGLAVATGDIVIFLNNDVQAEPGWLDMVARDVKPGGLYGPSRGVRVVSGQALAYIEGWCIAARRETWEKLGGWDAKAFTGLYWEDNELCWRAMQLGLRLIKTAWPIRHFDNTTSRGEPGAYDASERQRAIFENRVRASLEVVTAKLPAAAELLNSWPRSLTADEINSHIRDGFTESKP